MQPWKLHSAKYDSFFMNKVNKECQHNMNIYILVIIVIMKLLINKFYICLLSIYSK